MDDGKRLFMLMNYFLASDSTSSERKNSIVFATNSLNEMGKFVDKLKEQHAWGYNKRDPVTDQEMMILSYPTGTNIQSVSSPIALSEFVIDSFYLYIE